MILIENEVHNIPNLSNAAKPLEIVSTLPTQITPLDQEIPEEYWHILNQMVNKPLKVRP